jgi:hypothetical protein
MWSTSNVGLMLLNGEPTGITTNAGAAPHLHDFTIDSGFQGGDNTFAFFVNNGTGGQGGVNPTGLRVPITTATATSIPEPDSLLFLLLASCFSGVAAWRLKTSA